MRLAAAVAFVALVALVVASRNPSTKTHAFNSSRPTLFDRMEPVELRIEAPLQKLFDNGKDNERYTVKGTLSLKPPAAQPETLSNVEVSVRGNTSKRETECPFPKLKLKLPDSKIPETSLLTGLDSVKIGT